MKMGIQSRKNTATAKENQITVNINIEDKPVEVVKQPKPVVKVVKQPKPVVVKQRAPDKTPDRVEKLKENANKFQTLRNKALSQGVNLPQNFSAIPDIRNRTDLTSVNKTLLDKIRILEDKLKPKPKFP